MSNTETLDVERLLKSCCSQEPARHRLTEPWLAGDGVTVATDGRICVRTSHPTAAKAQPAGCVPPHGDLGWDRAYAEEPLSLPDAVENESERTIRCPACKGDGCLTCDLGHDHECDLCDGAGEIADWRVFDFGDVALSESYLSIIVEHGGRIYPAIDETGYRPVHVVFDDVTDALLMPCDLKQADEDVTIVRVD